MCEDQGFLPIQSAGIFTLEQPFDCLSSKSFFSVLMAAQLKTEWPVLVTRLSLTFLLCNVPNTRESHFNGLTQQGGWQRKNVPWFLQGVMFSQFSRGYHGLQVVQRGHVLQTLFSKPSDGKMPHPLCLCTMLLVVVVIVAEKTTKRQTRRI